MQLIVPSNLNVIGLPIFSFMSIALPSRSSVYCVTSSSRVCIFRRFPETCSLAFIRYHLVSSCVGSGVILVHLQGLTLPLFSGDPLKRDRPNAWSIPTILVLPGHHYHCPQRYRPLPFGAPSLLAYEDEDTVRQREAQASAIRQDRSMMPRTDGRPDKHTRRKLISRTRS